MENLSSETNTVTNSALSSARRLATPPPLGLNILSVVVKLYLYKMQSLHELLSEHNVVKEIFDTWALFKIAKEAFSGYLMCYGQMNNVLC